MALGSLIYGIIAVTIAVVVFVNVFMPTVKAANTSTWNTSEVALYGLVGLVGITGLISLILNAFGVV